MPLSAWFRAVPAIFARVRKRTEPRPWIVPAAVDFLEERIASDWHIFEFGSGLSTIWLSERAGRLVSIEHNERWFRTVSEQITRGHIANCELVFVPLESFGNYLADFEDESFEMILVDADERMEGERLVHLACATAKVKRGGYLMLDDSDRLAYRQADEMLAGWQRSRFVGVKPYPFVATETTVYRRP